MILGASTSAEVRAGDDPDVHLPAPVVAQQPAAASQPSPQPEGLARAASHTPGWIRGLTAQDLLWTLVIVLVSAAAYVPTFYGPSWGSLGDFGSAFVAGFVGKLVVNWAVLPAFASLTIRATPTDNAPT